MRSTLKVPFSAKKIEHFQTQDTAAHIFNGNQTLYWRTLLILDDRLRQLRGSGTVYLQAGDGLWRQVPPADRLDAQ